VTNDYAIYGCNYPARPPLDAGMGHCSGVANVAPVGTAPSGAGYWGQLDLAGELFEWNLDWYWTYAACTDCAYMKIGSTDAPYRVIRGGLFNLSASLLVPAYRGAVDPAGRSGGIGFRCARTP
jgi:formylglycine-generating enzyme required for sulfatase activity